MLTYEKVFEIFGDYLAEDSSCEVLQSSRGYLVVDWDSCQNSWVTAQLCDTPALLRDTLRSHYEEYQGYRLTDGYRRDVTDQEEQDIERMGAALATQCGGRDIRKAVRICGRFSCEGRFFYRYYAHYVSAHWQRPDCWQCDQRYHWLCGEPGKDGRRQTNL